MVMSNEGGNVSDLTIEVLKDIRGELRELRAETQGLRAETQGLRAETQGLRADLTQGLGEVRDELHELAEYTQAGFSAVLAQGDRRFLDHERRLRLLEEHTGLEPRRG
jgi:hypothetical protein